MKNYLLIALFFVFAYVIPSTGRPMMRPDEFRYGEIPTEMIELGDYTTPRLLGGRYFEKPPLGYWVTAGAIRLFGHTPFAVRFMSLFGAAGAALLIAAWVRRSTRDDLPAALAAILYLGCGLVYGLGTVAVLDSLLSCFTTGTLVCLFFALEERRFSRRRIAFALLAGVFAGLAFLTKGFIAFAIPALTAALYLVVERRWREFLLLPPLVLVGVLVVALPWALRIHAAEPDFWRYFVIEEHWKRFTDGTDQHPSPWWILTPILIGGSFPAALMLVAAADAETGRLRQLLRQPLVRFAAAGVVMPLIFFSVSRGKLPTYIAPCYGPLAVLMALAVAAGLEDGRKRFFDYAMIGWGILITVGGAGTVLFAALIRWSSLCRKLFPALEGAEFFFAAIGIVGFLCGLTAIAMRRRSRRDRFVFFWAAWGFGLAASVLLPDFHSGKMPEKMLYRFVRPAWKVDPAVDRVFCYSSSAHAVAWCVGGSRTRLLSAGEFEYGDREARKRGEEPLVWSRAELRRLIDDPARRCGVVLISDEEKDLPSFMAKDPALQSCRSGEFIAWRIPPREREVPAKPAAAGSSPR